MNVNETRLNSNNGIKCETRNMRTIGFPISYAVYHIVYTPMVRSVKLQNDAILFLHFPQISIK